MFRGSSGVRSRTSIYRALSDRCRRPQLSPACPGYARSPRAGYPDEREMNEKEGEGQGASLPVQPCAVTSHFFFPRHDGGYSRQGQPRLGKQCCLFLKSCAAYVQTFTATRPNTARAVSQLQAVVSPVLLAKSTLWITYYLLLIGPIALSSGVLSAGHSVALRPPRTHRRASNSFHRGYEGAIPK